MKKFRMIAAPIALAALTGLARPPMPGDPQPSAPSAQAEAEAAPVPALAPEESEPEPKREPRPAAGGEFFYSSDSDGTEVARIATNFDLRNVDHNNYIGASVEKALYNPDDRGWEGRERVFLRAADEIGGWQLKARVGTDGHTIIGSLSANDTAPLRKEVFVERDIVETPQGLDLGLYSTFAGAALDVPLDDRNVVTALAGLQTFTGDNERLHLRGSYIHVVKPKIGLSAQLRGRYFRNSEPAEFDYYSPRWYGEILPVLQMRRFVGGWELLGAAGLGMQRDSGSDWRTSRYAHARFRSPLRSSSDWAVNGAVTYTNTPSLSGASRDGYSYFQLSLGISRRF
jgi:hypothetical protein